MESNWLKELDVSELEPPHPMHQITAKLTALSLGEVLLVAHRRKPVPLFEMIEGRYEYYCHQIHDDRFQLLFWRKEDEQATQRAKRKIEELETL